MGQKRPWYTTFFEGLYGEALRSTFDEDQSLKQARMVKRLLKLRRGQRVLDIPCGLGRLTIPLAQMGLDMTGVDLTPPYLRTARRCARRRGLVIPFLECDMRDIDFQEEFHAAFNWFTSFGYFSDADNLRFCERVFRALKPGGRFLIESIHRSWLLSHVEDRHDQTLGRVQTTARTTWNARTQRITSRWTLRKGTVVQRRSFCLRIFDAPELRAVLRRAGFREIEMYGHPPAGRLHRHSRRIIAVGRRPGK